MNRLWKLFLCGFLSSSAFAPLFWTPALILGFIVLSAYLRECSTKKNAFFTGYVFSFGQFLSGLYWIAASLWVDIEHFWPWILPCVVIFPAYLAFYGGGVALLLHHVGQRMTPFYHLFFLGFFWIIAEQLRTYLFILGI
jgi:apolipoprotein N-acyltransferase